MDPFKALTKKETRIYDKTISNIRVELGSYSKISSKFFSVTGLHISGQTISVWFTEYKVPERYVALLCELMVEHPMSFFDLCPWLLPYYELWHQEQLDSEAANGWDK